MEAASPAFKTEAGVVGHGCDALLDVVESYHLVELTDAVLEGFLGSGEFGELNVVDGKQWHFVVGDAAVAVLLIAVADALGDEAAYVGHRP